MGTETKHQPKANEMSQFRANENYKKHLSNMDYSEIQNAKAIAMDNDDWDAYDQADQAEKIWLAEQ